MPESTTATEILRTEFDFKEGFLVKQKKYDFKKREEGIPYATLREHYRGNHQKSTWLETFIYRHEKSIQ